MSFRSAFCFWGVWLVGFSFFCLVVGGWVGLLSTWLRGVGAIVCFGICIWGGSEVGLID
jgi:hypothetical protein